MSSALPAFGHASFPAATQFGFKPNVSGGTGAAGASSPYKAGTQVTVYPRVPYEQEDPSGGADDTTVDVKIIVPDTWTSPACVSAQTQVIDTSTLNSNQPGVDVAGWSCAVEDAGGRKVIHWHGPQVVPPANNTNSAQFFNFKVTTPSPTAQTTYNGTAGTEGFIVDQTYASGTAEHWIPNAAFPGTAPAGSTTTVATGLVRTVAPVGVEPPPSPVTSGALQTITANVPAPGEEFTMTIPANPTVALAAGAATATYYPFTGALNAVSVTDTRSAKPTWSVSGVITDFKPNAVPGKYLGWTPKVLTAGAGAVAGPAVPSGITTGNGIRTSSVLATAPDGHPIGTASIGADLDLRLPLNTSAGSYSTTLTITAI